MWQPSKRRQFLTFTVTIAISLLGGVSGGGIMGIVAYVAGILLGTPLPFQLIVVIAVGFAITFTLAIASTTLAHFVRQDRQSVNAMNYYQHIRDYIGATPQTIAQYDDGQNFTLEVLHSADGRRQFRWSTYDIRDTYLGPHVHLSVVDASTGMILEDYTIPYARNMRHD